MPSLRMQSPRSDEAPEADKLLQEKPAENDNSSMKNSSHRYRQTLKDKTEIADQGIYIDENGNAFVVKGGVADKGVCMGIPSTPGPVVTTTATGNLPMPGLAAMTGLRQAAGGPPHGGNRNNGASIRGLSRLPRPMRGIPRGHGSARRPTGLPGGGGPPSGDGSHNGDLPAGSDDDDEPRSQTHMGQYTNRGST
ncbi:hypothetical protein IW262DRAFT_1451378 [Armillaria fumosa]|nr:hypothetical protein IW262DRAFT_1451378 [Armillaria fumosa]